METKKKSEKERGMMIRVVIAKQKVMTFLLQSLMGKETRGMFRIPLIVPMES